jgi:hypothetical protein
MSRSRPRGKEPGGLPRSPFGLVDELSCYYDTPAEPNNVHVEVMLPGLVDYLALRQAVAGAVAAAPRARGRMAPGRALRRRYTWEFPPALDADPVSRATWSSQSDLAAVRARFLATVPSLHRSPPVRVLLATGPGASCVILNAHHAALDGRSSLELLRDISRRYHAITGEPARPPASAPPRPPAAHPGRAPRPAPGHDRDRAPVPAGPPTARAARRFPVARVAADHDRAASGGNRDGYGVRLLYLATVPRVAGATVNDVLIAALVAAISRWNAAHRRSPRTIAITVPLDARGPAVREVAGNHSRIAVVKAGPETAAGDLPRLLAEVTRQTSTLRQAHHSAPREAQHEARPRSGHEEAPAGALGRAPGWCPVVVKRLAVRLALRVMGPAVCDTCMLTNLGNITDPPWAGPRGPVRVTLTGPAHMPRGVSVGAATSDGILQLGFRYRHALLDGAAADRFTALYVATLNELTGTEVATSAPAEELCP